MPSSYHVTHHVTPSDLEEGADPSRKPAGASVSELPYIIRLGIRFTASKYPVSFMVLCFLTGGWGGFQLFYFITESLVVSISIALLFSVGGLGYMGLADFSEGAFLELLLSDVKRTEKMAASAKGNMVGNFVLQFLVFMPLFFYFVIIPFTHSDLLGPHTYEISIVMNTISLLSSPISAIFDIQPIFTPEISRAWEIKINDYLSNIRNILLENSASDGSCSEKEEFDTPQQSINSGAIEKFLLPERNAEGWARQTTEKLALQQEMAEKWAREINKG